MKKTSLTDSGASQNFRPSIPKYKAISVGDPAGNKELYSVLLHLLHAGVELDEQWERCGVMLSAHSILRAFTVLYLMVSPAYTLGQVVESPTYGADIVSVSTTERKSDGFSCTTVEFCAKFESPSVMLDIAFAFGLGVSFCDYTQITVPRSPSMYLLPVAVGPVFSSCPVRNMDYDAELPRKIIVDLEVSGSGRKVLRSALLLAEPMNAIHRVCDKMRGWSLRTSPTTTLGLCVDDIGFDEVPGISFSLHDPACHVHILKVEDSKGTTIASYVTFSSGFPVHFSACNTFNADSLL